MNCERFSGLVPRENAQGCRPSLFCMAETHECEACGKEFESHGDLLQHTYDIGLVD